MSFGKIFFRWSQSLLRCPGTIIVIWLCLSTIFAFVSFFFFEIPDFSNPIEGFATKNTEISNRASSFRLLKKELQSGNQRVFLSPNSFRTSRSITTHSELISQHTLHCLPTTGSK
uniref:SSD domain-containing protein n=1 Tax=Ascaris lumbricoides TaxID=6252 RepID=A0A0M3I9S3_ASCLU